MAAVLAYGPDAVISHQTAAANWGIGPAVGDDPRYDANIAGAVARRSEPTRPSSTPDDIETHDGIPTTSVARTIYDLAAQRDETGLAHLLEEADRNELLDLRGARTRHGPPAARAAGVVRLTAAVADYRGPADTRSKLERAFRAFLGNTASPSRNTTCSWEASPSTASGRSGSLWSSSAAAAITRVPVAFQRDRVRDAIVQKAGCRVLRVTSKRLANERAAILADILALRS
jgi:hypothetical protein